MTISDRLQTHLDIDSERWDVSKLDSLEAITAVGDRRNRRRRTTPLLAALLIAGVAFASISFLQPSQSSRAVYATQQATMLEPQPVRMVQRDNALFGLGYREIDDNQLVAVILESADGEAWNEIADLSEFITFKPWGWIQHQLIATDTALHVVFAQESSTASSGWAIQQLSSADGREWSSTERAVVTSAPLPSFNVSDAVVSNDLIAVSLMGQSVITADFDEICEVTPPSGTGYFVRQCGSSEYEGRLIDVPTPNESREDAAESLFIAQGSNDFTALEVPEEYNFSGSNDSLGFDLFATDAGIGVSQRSVAEYSPDVGWQLLRKDVSPFAMVAVRGDERLIVPSFVQARVGPDSPIRGTWLFDADGWEAVDLGEFFEPSEIAGLHFSYISGGDAGWALVANHRGEPIPNFNLPDGPVDRDPHGQPFVLESANGWRFEGHTGWGPAILKDPDGEQVREWALFESSRPDKTGAGFLGGVVLFTDANNDDVLAEFGQAEWMMTASGHPAPSRTEVLWSPDGREWISVYDEETWIGQVVVTDDAFILDAHHYSNNTVQIDLPDTTN